MKQMAIFISYYSIDNSPSILNLLSILSKKAKITLFLQRTTLLDNPLLKKKNIQLVFWQQFYPSKIFLEFPTYIKNQLRLKYYQLKKYDVFINFDPKGYKLCNKLFPKAIPYFYSLELTSGSTNLFKRNLKKLKQAPPIKGLLIQSREREKIFRDYYYLDSRIPSLIIPVTYNAPIISTKSSYLRKLLNIDNSKKIILFLGGVAAWFSGIEFVRVMNKLKDCILVFHGFPDHNYQKRMEKLIKQNKIANVFFTNKTFKNIRQVDKILASADIGIAWYKPINENFTTAGFSSGKIVAYLRAGLPIIGNNYPSFKQAIEQTSTGICINSIKEIPRAVNKINNNYYYYSKNCFKEYNKNYHFINYVSQVEQFLNLD